MRRPAARSAQLRWRAFRIGGLLFARAWDATFRRCARCRLGFRGLRARARARVRDSNPRRGLWLARKWRALRVRNLGSRAEHRLARDPTGRIAGSAARNYRKDARAETTRR